MAVFKGHNSECDLQQNIMLFDLHTPLAYVGQIFSPYAERRK